MVTRGDRRWEWGSLGGTQAEVGLRIGNMRPHRHIHGKFISYFFDEKGSGVMEKAHFTTESWIKRSYKEC